MKWKNVPPILLILIPYLILFPIVMSSSFAAIMSILPPTLAGMYIPALLFGALPATMVLNLLCVCFVKWDTDPLARWNLRIKLWLIPVYLFIFVFAIGVPLAIPFLCLVDVVLILTSSGYGLRALLRARKEERIEKGMFLLLFLCHFCFVADVAAAFALQRKLKTIPIAQNL
jgi:CDP-diglyceride synthetase